MYPFKTRPTPSRRAIYPIFMKIILTLLVIPAILLSQEINAIYKRNTSKDLLYNLYEIYYGDTTLYEVKKGEYGEYYSIKEAAKDGFYKIYKDSSLPKVKTNLLEAGILKSTKRQGIHIKFFNGDTSEIIPYINGVKDGTEIMYNHFTNETAYTKWVNGRVETYKVYKNKTILVNDQKYYENGDSYWIFYYENGRVKQTTNTLKDTIYVVKYTEDGRINSVDIQLNSTQNIFYCNLKFNSCRVENFTQYLSRTESTLREYHSNGRLKSEMIWDKGKMIFSSFDETGKQIK